MEPDASDRPRRMTVNLSPMRRGQHVSRNVNLLQYEAMSVGDRLADALARFGGSWTFIILLASVLTIWLGLNSLRLLIAPFDPSPFIVLNLALAILASIQASAILMTQNQQAARDRLAAEQEYVCNLNVEVELARLHERLDVLCEAQQWDLRELQWHQDESLTLAQENGSAGQTGRHGGPPGREGGPRESASEATATSGKSIVPRRPRIVDGQRRFRCRHEPPGSDTAGPSCPGRAET